MSKSQPWDYFPLLPVFAFTDVSKAKRFVKSKTGIDMKVNGKQGQCTWFDHDDTGGFVVVLLICDESSATQKYACLAHECVHYAQFYADMIDGKLDNETEAYTMQSAMLACVEQIGEEWFTETPHQKKAKKS